MNISRKPWSVQVKIIVIVLLLAAFTFVFAKFRVAMAPLAIAVILAYILTPIVNFLQFKLRFPRILAILLVFLILLAILAALLTLAIPFLINQVSTLNVDINTLLYQVENLLSHQIVIGNFRIDVDRIANVLVDALQTAVEPMFGRTVDILTSVVESFVWIIFILIISIYLIKDSAAIYRWFEGLIPPNLLEDFIRLRDEINTIWGAFFRGQLLLALIVSCIITAEGYIIGLSFPIVMGITAGLLEFLPSVGHGIWIFLASLSALFLGSTQFEVMPNWVFFLIVIGMHLVFTQFDLNYLIPRIIGRSVHLPPMVVILGIVAGASLAGVMGVLLAAPSIASFRVLGRYIYASLFDLDPFPEDKPSTLPLPPPELRWWKKTQEKDGKNGEVNPNADLGEE